MHEIIWPEGYVPGFVDNFASNECIVTGLRAADIWPHLSHPNVWPTYYRNASDIAFYDGAGPELALGVRFHFATFGFPIEAEVTEYVPPEGDEPGRIAWHAWAEGDADHRLDVHHAWLIENLSGGRVRVLTQETQNGKPARDLAAMVPNPMINGHQEWLTGLVASARAAL